MEAIALMADIHANLPAAEAVIADIRRKHKPDRIVSLGDQVNLGPAPFDTLRDNNDIAPFKNILNEMYSKDISKKVHSSYLFSVENML